MKSKLSAGAWLAVGGLALAVSAGAWEQAVKGNTEHTAVQQPERKPTPVQEKPVKEGKAGVPEGVPELKHMLISKALFTPDKWWQYEGPEEELPNENSVDQGGTISLGGRLIVNHGACVKYLAKPFPSEKEAHAYFLTLVPAGHLAACVHQTIKRTKNGNESFELVQTTVGPEGVATEIVRKTYARYGTFVLEIGGNSDMKAMGPRPANGERKWLCEPVYEKVRAAALARWNHYKTTVASSR